MLDDLLSLGWRERILLAVILVGAGAGVFGEWQAGWLDFLGDRSARRQASWFGFIVLVNLAIVFAVVIAIDLLIGRLRGRGRGG